MKKCLVLYSSLSGFTERIALTIANRFKKQGWLVDLKRIDEGWQNHGLDLQFKDYDFLCAGSWTYFSLPTPWIQEALRSVPFPSGKIFPGPKCGLAFCTYGGEHLGLREADACLTLLEILYEHHGFRTLGSIAIQNKQGLPPLDIKNYDPDLHEWPLDGELKRLHAFLDNIFDHPELDAGNS